jgi:hypothetical protein
MDLPILFTTIPVVHIALAGRRKMVHVIIIKSPGQWEGREKKMMFAPS